MFSKALRRRADGAEAVRKPASGRARSGGGTLSRLLRFYARIYRADQWFERRFTPLGRLVIGSMVVAALFGLDTRRSQAYQLFALLGSLSAVSFVLSRRPRQRLSVERALPGFATVGVPFEYSLRLSHGGPHTERSLWLHDDLHGTWPTVRDAHAIGAKRALRYRRWLSALRTLRGGRCHAVAAPALPAGERTDVRARLNPVRRGYLHLEAVAVGRPDPLGLARALYRVPVPGRLLVLPRRHRVDPRLVPGGGRRRGSGGGLGPNAGQSEEFLSLREYRPGDPMRHIHWKSWARRGEPIVKEFHEEADRRMAILLDHYGARLGEPAFEDAVDAASSFAVAALEHGAVVELVLAERSVDAGAGRDRSADGLLAALATVEGAPAAGLNGAAARLEGASHALSGVVCVFRGFDAERAALVKRLEAAAVAVQVVVVTDDPQGVRVQLEGGGGAGSGSVAVAVNAPIIAPVGELADALGRVPGAQPAPGAG